MVAALAIGRVASTEPGFVNGARVVSVTETIDEIDFTRDIQPLLSDRCYFCHGPDSNKREGGFRLDLESEAMDYIEPGDAENSELFERITSDDPDDIMPPPHAKVPLTEEEKQLIGRWIDSGADWKKHWAFQTPVAPEVPADEDDNWSTSELDRFVFRRLKEEGLQPSQRATRQQLIRRLTFDLNGVPPTIEEIEAFVSDDDPDAYEKLVDRLLASSRFGERVASNWMDIARYSDSYGYQVDRDRFVWPWRDWVIDAINDNMPYDQFITEQIAGDLIPDATDAQILATTFCRLHPQKVEGGSVEEEFRVEYVADRAQTVATAFLGLTLECARCHDHKFDPLSQKEYYQLFAFFNNIDESGLYSFFTDAIPTPNLLLMDEAQKTELASLTTAVEEAAKKVQQARQQQPAAFDEWLTAIRATATSDSSEAEEAEDAPALRDVSNLVRKVDLKEVELARNELVDGPEPGSIAVKLTGDDEIQIEGVGNFDRFQPFTIACRVRTTDMIERAVIFHRSRAWTDAASRGYELLIIDGHLQASLVHFWPGNAISVQTETRLPLGKWTHIAMAYDGSNRASGISIWIDGLQQPVVIVRDNLDKTITGGGQDFISIGARFRDRGFSNSLVTDFKVFDRDLSELEITCARDGIANVIKTDSPDEQLKARLLDYYLSAVDPVVSEANAELRAAREKLCKKYDSLESIMVMREMETPRTAFVLNRGAYDSPILDHPVTASTPEIFPPMDDGLPKNRLGLARWLTSPDNPLTARVAVNRFWQMIFGGGLVRTPEDFGRQGATPTHPELLDHLATGLIADHWNTKSLIKKIVMSSTYQQSSRVTAELYERDPENRLLARAPSFRMPAEMLRDNSLSVSGLLIEKHGGAPVRPYDLDQSFKPVNKDVGEGLYRRSIYSYWNRTGPSPLLTSFDAPGRDVCTVKRESTSSPLQSLVLLNSPQFVEAARKLSERLLLDSVDKQNGEKENAEREDNEDKEVEIAQTMFRTLTGRLAEEKELDIIVHLFRQQREYFATDEPAATAFLTYGDSVVDAGLDQIEVAAWANVALTLFSHDECVTRR